MTSGEGRPARRAAVGTPGQTPVYSIQTLRRKYAAPCPSDKESRRKSSNALDRLLPSTTNRFETGIVIAVFTFVRGCFVAHHQPPDEPCANDCRLKSKDIAAM